MEGFWNARCTSIHFNWKRINLPCFLCLDSWCLSAALWLWILDCRALSNQSWWDVFITSLGEATVSFNLNSSCHGLLQNDTQHHTPESLDEFFALCPHFKWFLKIYCFAAHCTARHPDKCLITTSCWLIKSIEFPALSLSDNRIVLAQCL